MPTFSGRSAARSFSTCAATLLLFLLSGTPRAHAQNRFEWSVYSALNAVQSVAFDTVGTIWAGTTGGVVGYHPVQDSFEVYRTTEGLMTLNTTAVGVDAASGALYAGAADGSISIRTRDGAWHGVADINTVERSDRRIEDFRFHDGLVYVLTAFGVAVFDPTDTTFPETWTRFGSLPPSIAVHDLLFWRDSIWLATDRGLARAPQRGTLLPNPLSWTVFDSTSGLAGERVLSLAIVAGDLVVATDAGIFSRSTDGRFVRRAELPSVEPFRLAMNGTTVAASTLYALYRSQNGAQFLDARVTAPAAIDDIAVGPDGTIAVALRGNGIGIVRLDTLRMITPSSPASNYFSDLALGSDGSIWTSSGQGGSGGSGLSRLKDGLWRRYTSGRYPDRMIDAVQNVGVGGDGSVWAGAWGSGAVRIMPVDTGAVIERFNQTNSPLTADPIVGDDRFIIVGDIAADSHGRTWIVNHETGAGGNPLLVVRMTPAEAAQLGRDFISVMRPETAPARSFRWIVVDQNDTKWVGSYRFSGAGGTAFGLHFYRNRELIEQPGTWGRLGTEHGLVSNTQTALAVDRDGAVWIGAPTGLAVLDNPFTVATEGAQTARVRNSEREPGNCCRALRDVSVQAIAVDALNRKWIGTSQGVFVLSPDGIDVLYRFTADNSPLVDDDVHSLLAVDSTGDVYIGTANGLNRVSTDAVEAPSPVGNLTIWPQPFLVPSDEPARIAGLPPNASVKILTTSGRLVRQFDSPGGGVAFWDGRDRDHAPVPSGIYIVAAGASAGEETVVGKIAVVRR